MNIITSIERQKKNRHRVSVYLDGEFAFGLNDDAVFRFGLRKGMELGEELRAEIERFDNLVQAKLAAERLIAVRPRSEKELRQRLAIRGFPPDAIDEVVTTFLRVQLLNDLEFARSWVRDRLRLRPRAASALRRELRGKGIHDDIITRVLAEAFEEKEDLDVARQLAAAWCGKRSSLERDVLRRRLAGYLQRKGYSASVVYDVLGEMDRWGEG
jgi:regulatory protein